MNEEKEDLSCPPVSAAATFVKDGAANLSVAALESKLSAMTVPTQQQKLLVDMEMTAPWYEQVRRGSHFLAQPILFFSRFLSVCLSLLRNCVGCSSCNQPSLLYWTAANGRGSEALRVQ